MVLRALQQYIREEHPMAQMLGFFAQRSGVAAQEMPFTGEPRILTEVSDDSPLFTAGVGFFATAAKKELDSATVTTDASAKVEGSQQLGNNDSDSRSSFS